MLRGLTIRNMLLIDHLELEFQGGLNVLTGETGAGKSILLDSLGFVLGWRGRADLVRQGADQGEVTAEFCLAPTHPAVAVLDDQGISLDEGALILRRVNTIAGRKTAWVNGTRVSGDTLRDLSGHLVELHGQHGDRGLLNPRGHRLLLDAFAGADTALVRAAWDQVRRSTADLKQAEASLAEAAKDAEYLRHAVAEMEDLAPELGEADALDTRRRAMRTGAQVAEDVARAAAALGPEGAEGLLFDATRWLEGSADGVDGALEGGLDPALDALARAVTELGEAQGAVETCLAALAFDPAELERVEDRLFAVRALARKHSCGPDDLPSLGRDLRARLDLIDTGDAHLADLRAAQSQVQADYDAAAAKLSDQRAEAAARLDTAMGAELAPLKLERAIFATDLTRGEPGPEGTDTVAFTVATNPGAPAGPIDKISSGGELSRFLLALKVCLTRRAEGVTLIFDEIDRGVGGATADAIGRRLATLAENAQILVVTHSPQVAAQGGHQWRVSKSVEAGETLSRVAKLDADARRREIARMLAGDVITPEAEAAAAALLTR